MATRFTNWTDNHIAGEYHDLMRLTKAQIRAKWKAAPLIRQPYHTKRYLAEMVLIERHGEAKAVAALAGNQ